MKIPSQQELGEKVKKVSREAFQWVAENLQQKN